MENLKASDPQIPFKIQFRSAERFVCSIASKVGVRAQVRLPAKADFAKPLCSKISLQLSLSSATRSLKDLTVRIIEGANPLNTLPVRQYALSGNGLSRKFP